jgi:hypothetical protein
MQSRIDFAHRCGKFSLGKLLFRLLIVLRWTDCDLECEKPDHRSLPPRHPRNGRLELDSRNKLATSRSKVSSCIGDAVAEEAEPVGNASSALLREAWALVEDGVASCEDIDRTMRDGLGWRWSFMGPFETIDLNAHGGVADYAKRLGTLCQEIAHSRTHQEPWSPELISKVEAERRSVLSQRELASRRAWRDRRLMALAAEREKEPMP